MNGKGLVDMVFSDDESDIDLEIAPRKKAESVKKPASAAPSAVKLVNQDTETRSLNDFDIIDRIKSTLRANGIENLFPYNRRALTLL